MLIRDDPVHAFLSYDPVEVPFARSGPLAGLTFAVKDIFDVAGYPTGCGSPVKLAESPVCRSTAPVVQALLDAGARFVGKTQTDELAFSLNGQNRHFQEPINPRAPDRITGGSSSGSAAAVAAGLCDLAVGSDTGGSIRAPASYCGLWGIRPTHGRVSLAGVMPLAPSFDTPGYFADKAEVFARVAPVFLGDDDRPFRLFRLLRAEDCFARLLSSREAEALRPAQRTVCEHLGAPAPVTAAPRGLEDCYWAFRRLQAAEAWEVHGSWIESRDPEMTPGVRERFSFGSSVTAQERAAAGAVRQALAGALDELLGDDAVLMLPTVPSIAPLRHALPEDLQSFRDRALQILCVAGLAGLPQVAMPLAELGGCPLGLSLIGPRGSDRALVALCVAIAGTG